MSVLFVTHYSGFYGANKSLLSLLVLLRERHGIIPCVLLPTEGQMCEELEKLGIYYKVSHYYWWVNNNHGFFQWLLNKRKQIINLMNSNKLCKLFGDRSIDLVYSNSICVNVGFLLAKRMHVPHIWQARESLVQFSFSLSRCASRSILFSTVNRVFILISDYMVNYYKQFLPNDRTIKIYNGVSLPQNVYRLNENTFSPRLQISCIGVLCEQKNQIELLRAQSLLHREGIDVETWFIGVASSEYKEFLYEYICNNNLQAISHIVGHTDNVFGFLQHMNVGVVSAHDEAFGRVTIEYMLMRMPVIVSNSGANMELVDAGMTGAVYEIGNIEALARAIKAYVDKPELLIEQGTRAERKAKEHFSAERNADLIFEQINRIIL